MRAVRKIAEGVAHLEPQPKHIKDSHGRKKGEVLHSHAIPIAEGVNLISIPSSKREIVRRMFVLRTSKFGFCVKQILKRRRWAFIVHRLIS